MKLILALCFVLSVATADWTVPTPDEIRVFRRECMESEKVSDYNQKKLFVGLYPNDPSIRCYLRCVMTKNGVWDDTNGFDWERSLKLLEARKNTVAKEAFDKCTSKNGEDLDACTWAYKGFTCLLDNNYLTPLPTN